MRWLRPSDWRILVAEHLRGEDEKGKYDFVVSRAVMQLPDLMKIIKKNFKKAGQNALPNGLALPEGRQPTRGAEAALQDVVRNHPAEHLLR